MRRTPFLSSLIFLLIALLLSLAIGSVFISPKELWLVILGNGNETFASILWKIRLPRTVLIALTGAALGGSGATYQGLFRNPLADPFLIGVASGAGLGAVIAMSIKWPYSFWGLMAIPMSAFIAALLTVFIVYSLARVGNTIPTTNLILAGVAFSSFATSLTSFLMLRSTGEVRRALGWLLGGASQSGWTAILAIMPYLLIGIGVLIFSGHALNLLQFGDEQAQQLGLNVTRTKRILLTASSLATAAAVAFYRAHRPASHPTLVWSRLQAFTPPEHSRRRDGITHLRCGLTGHHRATGNSSGHYHRTGWCAVFLVGFEECEESRILVTMEITIRKIEPHEAPQTKSFSRKSLVNSRLVLKIENEQLGYTIVPVTEPYEREVHAEDVDYGFDEAGSTIFFAEVDGKLAGRIRMLKWWNQFGYVEDLVVNPEYRGMDIGRKLLEHGIQWARENNFPGVMLETQDDNVPACTLYQSCGFILSGFDRNVYKAINPNTKETALYWYLIF
jgi:iron complex transport system permease protein